MSLRTPISEDFVILSLPCIVPAPGSLPVKCPFSLELDLGEFFEALVEVEFLLKGFVSVPVYYQLGPLHAKLSFEASWPTEVFLTLRTPNWMWCVAWGHPPRLY